MAVLPQESHQEAKPDKDHHVHVHEHAVGGRDAPRRRVFRVGRWVGGTDGETDDEEDLGGEWDWLGWTGMPGHLLHTSFAPCAHTSHIT